MFPIARRPIRLSAFVLLVLGCFVCSNASVEGRSSIASADGLVAADQRPDGPSHSASPIHFDGWRRTVNGWERLPFRSQRPSINDWIASQKQEEANNPLTQFLWSIGRIHPIRIAAAEIAIACVIALVASERRNWTAERAEQETADAVR